MNAPRSAMLLAAVALFGLLAAPAASGAFAATFGTTDVVDSDDVDIAESDDAAADAESTAQDESTSASDDESASDTDDESAEEIEIEQGVNSFMHSSAADTSDAVDSGMFEAEYEDASNETQAELVDERADGLTSTLESLETEREELRDNRDELSAPQYEARMTQLTVKITALERSVEQTKPFALDTNVGIERLESVQESVSELGGQQIAEVAKGLVGFDQHLDDTVDDADIESDDADDEASDTDDADDVDGETIDTDDADDEAIETEGNASDAGNESVGETGEQSADADNETVTEEREGNESVTE